MNELRQKYSITNIDNLKGAFKRAYTWQGISETTGLLTVTNPFWSFLETANMSDWSSWGSRFDIAWMSFAGLAPVYVKAREEWIDRFVHIEQDSPAWKKWFAETSFSWLGNAAILPGLYAMNGVTEFGELYSAIGFSCAASPIAGSLAGAGIEFAQAVTGLHADDWESKYRWIDRVSEMPEKKRHAVGLAAIVGSLALMQGVYSTLPDKWAPWHDDEEATVEYQVPSTDEEMLTSILDQYNLQISH